MEVLYHNKEYREGTGQIFSHNPTRPYKGFWDTKWRLWREDDLKTLTKQNAQNKTEKLDMASTAATTETKKQDKKQQIGQKRKLPSEEDDLDLFNYGNKMKLTFSYSTKNTKNMITIDSSDDEEEEECVVDDTEFTRISDNEEEVCGDDSEEFLNM